MSDRRQQDLDQLELLNMEFGLWQNEMIEASRPKRTATTSREQYDAETCRLVGVRHGGQMKKLTKRLLEDPTTGLTEDELDEVVGMRMDLDADDIETEPDTDDDENEEEDEVEDDWKD